MATRVDIGPEEREAIDQIMAEIVDAHRALGHAREQACQREQELLGVLRELREKYRLMADLLARKYVKGPGEYEFHPEQGAFIER